MRVFLKDDVPNDDDDDLTRPIITEETEGVNQNESNSPVKIPVCKKIPSIRDLICLLRSSVTLSQAAVVAFFSGLSEGGMQASFLYFLKAQFHFNKNQFADLMLIAGLAGTISQLLFMPLLAPILGEAKLLSLGLFAACINMFICSISWSAWVPYATTAFSVLVVFATPSFRSIVSKQVGPNEQGKAQGCISGISSFANIVSPLIFSPLTALFLSKGAPFNFPGFSIMCIGLASMVAFIQSLMMSHTPASSKSQNQCCLA
ncbi:Major facilitator superfamily protein [Citrus sinensis]|nr:Major facilitator superfamily protein [Citrus sinensis]